MLFDVGDTLLIEQRFDLEAGIAAAVGELADERVLAREFTAEAQALRAVHREAHLASWLQRHVNALANDSVDRIEDRVWRAVVALTPFPGVADVIRRLAHDHIPMAAISNAAFSGRVLMDELARHDLAPFVQFVISSADLDVRKPAPAIYHAALARLNTSAARTWFVGDTPDEDIAGAIAVGLPAFLLQTAHAPVEHTDGFRILRNWTDFVSAYATAIGPSAHAS